MNSGRGFAGRVFVALFGALWVLAVSPVSAQVPGADRSVVVAPASSGVAASTATQPANYYRRLHAVCIGIDDYAATAIDDLSYAEADAREVAALLRGCYGFGSVRELIGGQATRQGIVDAVSELFDKQRVSRDDAVVVYFSGHGQTIDTPRGGQMGFLIPQDARIDLSQVTESGPYYKTCIAMEDVRKWRQLIPARHVLFVADSCYSGLLGVEKSMPRPIGDALSLEVCQILTAGTRGQKVPESSNVGHGAFTAKLLEALRTCAADLNKDGYIRASELGQYLKDCNLPGQSPQSKVMDGEGDFILWPRVGGVVPPEPGGTAELDRVARLAELTKAAESAFAKAEQVDASGLSGAEKIKAWESAEPACVPVNYRLAEVRARIAHWKACETAKEAYSQLKSRIGGMKPGAQILEWQEFLAKNKQTGYMVGEAEAEVRKLEAQVAWSEAEAMESGNKATGQKLQGWKQCLDKCRAANWQIPEAEARFNRWDTEWKREQLLDKAKSAVDGAKETEKKPGSASDRLQAWEAALAACRLAGWDVSEIEIRVSIWDAWLKAERLESGNASAAEKLKAWAQCLDKCAAAKMRAPFVEGQIDKWRKAIRVDYREDANCGLGLQMIWIPGGPFTMGAPESEANAHDDEKPARQVTVDGFWMAKCETTNRQFRQFLKESSYNGRGDGNEDYLAHFSSEDASTPSGDDYPVVYVSWKNAVEFCAWLSRMTGQKYALPTEAQWEYSCRAGSQTPYSFGSDLARLSDYGWYSENSGEKTNPVGQKLPNKWGLHDMHGNVWEWCFDWYGPLSYGQLPNKNPAGLPTGVQHVLRGGSWHTLPLYLRSTHRLNRLPNYCDKVLGFRVVRNEGAQVLPAAPPSPNPVPGHDFTEEYIDLGLKMLWITGGEFLMGSSEDENHDDDECPQHKVELDGFWLGRHEVTVEQFRKFAQAARYKTEAEKRGKSWGRQDVGFGETEGLTWVSPGFEQLESHPVVHVSWNDAAAFCRWLSEKTGRHYGLPTEAQWEYACRAGSRTTWSWGDGAEGGEGYLNGRDHSFGGQFSSDGSSWGEADQTLFDFDDKYVCTSPVGIFKANRWRVCDMHGNVREWCFDRYSKQYSEKAPRNPRGTTGEDGHVMRGGSWLDIPERVRSAYRERAQAGYSSSWVGFRVAAEASQR